MICNFLTLHTIRSVHCISTYEYIIKINIIFYYYIVYIYNIRTKHITTLP